MNCKISFDFFTSPEQEAMAREAVEHITPLLPRWLRRLGVQRYESYPDDPSCPCAVETSYQYRRAYLSLYNPFFGCAREEMRELLVHELVHIYHGGVERFVQNRLIDFAENKNPDLAIVFQREYTDRNEAFTEDLTGLLLSLLPTSIQKGEQP